MFKVKSTCKYYYVPFPRLVRKMVNHVLHKLQIPKGIVRRRDMEITIFNCIKNQQKSMNEQAMEIASAHIETLKERFAFIERCVTEMENFTHLFVQMNPLYNEEQREIYKLAVDTRKLKDLVHQEYIEKLQQIDKIGEQEKNMYIGNWPTEDPVKLELLQDNVLVLTQISSDEKENGECKAEGSQ